MQKVEESKARELNCLRRQQAQKLRAGYESCLFQVGDAHIAAARENEFAKKLKQQKVRNDILAKRRGREAMQRAKQTRKGSPKKNVRHPRSKSVSIQVDNLKKDVSNSLPSTSKHINVSSPIDLSSSQNEEKEENDGNRKQSQIAESHMEYVNISSESLSSSLELIATDSKLSKVLPLAYEKTSSSENSNPKTTMKEDKNQQKVGTVYNPDNFKANDTSENSLSNEGELPFTQVSDFLNKRRLAQNNAIISREPEVTKTLNREPSIELISKSEEIKEDNKTAKSVSPAKKISSQNQSRSPIKKNRPQSLGAKKKLTKPTYVPMFYRPSTSAISSSKPTKSSIKDDEQKVQFYDHANRYSKEYEPSADLIKKISPKSNERNATEAAREEIKFEELRLERAKELQ